MKLPHRFGKYELTRKIAQGGMAEIYKARYHGESGFSKDIAVKMIIPNWSENESLEGMLIDEAKALTYLHHRNIVQVLELGKDEDQLFISMEFVDGIDLRQLYNKLYKTRDLIPEKYVVYIISEILKALQYAHSIEDDEGNPLNIVHRDISPQNIMVSKSGEVKLTDFGIAKGLHRVEETTHAQLKGKYAYMSPEQASGNEIDFKSDIFSTGIILYELLTGERLFHSVNDLDTLKNVTDVQMPAGWEPCVSLTMRGVLKKALSKNPEERYASSEEFLKDLGKYVSIKRYYIFETEFAEYIKKYLTPIKKRSLKVKKENKTKVFKKIKKTAKKRKNYGPFLKRYLTAAAIFGIIFVSTLGNSFTGGDTLIRTRPEHNILKSELVSLEMPKIDFNNIKGVSVKNAQPAKKSDGWLSIHAKPWGHVYIPGIMKRSELPISKFKLTTGKHRVKIHYPPKDIWASADIDIKASGSYRCFADFTKGNKLKCR